MLNEMKNLFRNDISEASDCDILSDNFLKEEADKAIDRLINHQDLGVIQQWRGKHLSPMIQLKDFVIQETEKLQIKPVFVSARLKMITTILDKIKTGRHTKLSTMQDLGGVRIVFDNSEDLYTYYNEILKSKAFKILRTKDYIKEPKETGYRGIHIVYNIYGYNIELQLRTEGQHIWATTVETVGWYLKQDLKSGKGEEEYLKTFKEFSSFFNDKESGSISSNPLIESNLFYIIDKAGIYCFYPNVINGDNSCNINLSLWTSSDPTNRINGDSDLYFCITGREYPHEANDINISEARGVYPTNIYGYQNNFSANNFYEGLEKTNHDKNILVWVSNASKLENAYPCFFLWTAPFLDSKCHYYYQDKEITDYLEGL